MRRGCGCWPMSRHIRPTEGCRPMPLGSTRQFWFYRRSLMAFGVKIHCWGEFACFTRPEMKVERVSYDVITPSAARGVVEAIYWKPEIKWVVDRLHVLEPIRFTSQRRNEVGAKASAGAATKVMNAGRGNLG